ncbi:MAG: N-acetylmuramoyl-L-alanine amidase [Clostridia bacterium]
MDKKMVGVAALILALVMAAGSFACAGEIGFSTGMVGDGGDLVGRLDGLLIGIDAGHQAHGNSAQEAIAPGSHKTKAKVSTGTTGNYTKIPEHVVNLQVALLLRDALEKEGAKVKMVRESADVDISNIERAQMMNDAGADLVLRIHCNSAGGPEPCGTELYVRSKGAKAEESYRAAQAILPAMIEATRAKSRGIEKNDSYTGLNWSEVPSILVEMGFMSNPQEDPLLVRPDYQAKLVAGMVEGIARYFEKGEATEASEVPEAPASQSPEALGSIGE